MHIDQFECCLIKIMSILFLKYRLLLGSVLNVGVPRVMTDTSPWLGGKAFELLRQVKVGT